MHQLVHSLPESRAPERPVSEDEEGRGAGDPDADVCALVAEGALEQALISLMERHGEAVFRYCVTALDDETLARDVQQQVFIEAHRDLKKFSGRSILRGWLFGIARHRVLDQKRVVKRNLSRTRPLRDTNQDPQPAVSERIDQARLVEALRECLATLGEHILDAVLLRFQQGFSFEEMARISDELPGTLQARVKRALPVLRKCIEARTGGSV